jgi:hypothetical protein
MRLPGFEPGLEAVSPFLAKQKGCWEAPVIATRPQPHNCMLNTDSSNISFMVSILMMLSWY